MYAACRIWDVECGVCLRTLEGHEELVRCLRFDDRYIISGAYDGYVLVLFLTYTRCIIHCELRVVYQLRVCCVRYSKIKVWDLTAALDLRSAPNALCIRTLTVCTIVLAACIHCHLSYTHARMLC